MSRAAGAVACVVSVVIAACGEETPTSVGIDLLPPEPLTIEIELPWDDFGSNLAVYGGYSTPSALPEGMLASTYGPESLNMRTLVRFASYPASASVRDTLGTLRTDTNLTFLGGYIVTYLDTIASTNTGPVTIALGAMQEEWHGPSATWASALDTIGDDRPWSEAGGGAVVPLATAIWDPADGDSVRLFLDSAQVAAWTEQEIAPRSARFDLVTDGERLRIRGAAIRLYTLASVNPDTALVLTSQAQEVTFVYDVDPATPSDGMRVGGAPSWRTVIDVAVPAALTGPPELCAAVQCPFALAPRHVSYASLGLRSRNSVAAFQPTDSISLDVRPVLSRAALPKSPLGLSLSADGTGQRVEADAFAVEGSLVEVPITNYVKAYLAGPDPSGRPPPGSLALLAAPEPSSFSFGEFFGPGVGQDPILKLIITVSQPMELP